LRRCGTYEATAHYCHFLAHECVLLFNLKKTKINSCMVWRGMVLYRIPIE